MYEDETLVCRDCGQEFVFSASEQAFFAEKGFMNKPSRCPKCRAARRAQNGNGSSAPRQMYDVVCANCGKATQVPFQPRGDRPVLCRECFDAQRCNSTRKNPVGVSEQSECRRGFFAISEEIKLQLGRCLGERKAPRIPQGRTESRWVVSAEAKTSVIEISSV